MSKKILFIMLVLSLGLMVVACTNHYSIETEVSEGGVIEISPTQDEYEEGEEITIEAVADASYDFVEWSGDLEGRDNPKEVEISADLNIEAEFATNPDYFEFDIKTGKITGYSGDSKDIVIPSEIDCYSVTEISRTAFFMHNLETVEIPDSVTEIGSYAFRSNEITSVEIPDGLTEIVDGAFKNNELTSVEIPDGVTEIGVTAFKDNDLISVEIPDSVTKIGDWAFKNNELTSVEIPDNVTEIGSRAFSNNNLTSVEIPDSVTEIGDNSTFANNELTEVEIPDSITEIGAWAFIRNELTSVKIPDSVTKIGMNAFRSNELTSVEIPDSVTEIGRGTFKDNDLTEIVMPANVDLVVEIDTTYYVDSREFDKYDLMGEETEFKDYYNEQDKEAGTYIKNSYGDWELQE